MKFFNIKKLGTELMLTRDKRGKTLRGSAFEIGIPHCTLDRLEKGKQLDIHTQTLVKACNWLGVNPSEFFDDIKIKK